MRYGACVRTTPDRGAKLGPLEPPIRTTNPTPADATSVLRAMPQPWRVRGKDARNLTPAIEAALASGWTTENLTRHLSRNPAASESRRESWLDVSRIYPTHRQDLCPTAAWCGECEDERS